MCTHKSTNKRSCRCAYYRASLVMSSVLSTWLIVWHFPRFVDLKIKFVPRGYSTLQIHLLISSCTEIKFAKFRTIWKHIEMIYTDTKYRSRNGLRGMNENSQKSDFCLMRFGRSFLRAIWWDEVIGVYDYRGYLANQILSFTFTTRSKSDFCTCMQMYSSLIRS